MTLYEIDERLKNLENFGVDTETGEVVETKEDFEQAYNEIQMDLNVKIENTLCFIKNLQAEADAIKAEEQKLAKRRKSRENLAARLTEHMDNYAKAQCLTEDGELDNEKLHDFTFESPRAKMSFRKSESLALEDIDFLPKEYIVTTYAADKKTIKKDLKAGKTIAGASIQENYLIQIK